MPLMQLLIIVRTVLDPSVGVMEQALSALTPSQQHGEQCIAPEPDALLLKGFGKHALKLARAHSRLAHALVLNQLHHDFGVHASLDLPTATLIVGLATQAHELASPAYAEPLDEGLLEDLPKGFFTMRTP